MGRLGRTKKEAYELQLASSSSTSSSATKGEGGMFGDGSDSSFEGANNYDGLSSGVNSRLFYDDELDLLEGDDDYDELNKPKEASWQQTAATIAANVVGVGLLALPGAFSQLGWPLAFFVLIVVTLISVYSALILAWLKGAMRHITTYPGLAGVVTEFKGAKASGHYRRFIRVILFAYLLGICTVYLTTLKLSLEQIFQKCTPETGQPTVTATNFSIVCEPHGCSNHGVADLPDTLWLLIAAVCVFPFVHFRRLAHAGLLYVISMITITAVAVIIIYRCAKRIEDFGAHVSASPSGDLRDVISGIVTIVFSFGGHSVLLDIVSEMRDISEFPRSVYLSQGYMFVLYALIGMLGYAAFGPEDAPSPITLGFPRDHLNIFTNVLLMVHVTVAYCINSTVFVKNVFKTLWPRLFVSDHHNREKALRWGFLATLILLLAFCISVIVPYFRDIMNLYSSISTFSLSVWVPPFLFLIARKHAMSSLLVAINVLLIVIGVCGMAFGVWATLDDVVDRVRHCRLRA